MTATKFSKARVYQKDIETSILHFLNGDSLPLAHLPYEAFPAGMHHTPQRSLPLLSHGEVVAHIDECMALQE